MKKKIACAIVSIIVVLSVTICFFIFNKKDKDKKIVEHLSNQKYAEDIVANGEMKKYDIAPAATPAVEKETPLKYEKLDNKIMESMVPIFTGIGAYMCETNSEYDGYSDKFYAEVIKYASIYGKESIKKGCNVDNDKIILSKNALIQISGVVFASRLYGYEEFDLKKYNINYDKKTDKYSMNNDVVTGYSIVIDYVKEVVVDSDETDDELYEVLCIMLKDGNRINQVKFHVIPNQLENDEFYFSIKNAYLIDNIVGY